MKFEIPRIPIRDISKEEFVENYYDPERPVIFTGLESPGDESLERLLQEKENRSGLGFVGSPLIPELEKLKIPTLVTSILERDDIVLRVRPVRIWMQSKGHRTMLHYDGNSLHGFNWQVTGTKHWTLISPDTPPPLYPFHPYTMTSPDYSPDAERHDFSQFIMEPGELLFVPRYWFHEVTALEDRTSNINWVWTPRTPNLTVAIGRRECAVLAWRNLIPGLSRLIYEPTSLRNYGGGGEEMSKTYASAVHGWDLIKHLAFELVKLPLVPFHYVSLRRQARHSKESLI